MSILANIGLRTKLLGAFGGVLVILLVLSNSAYQTTVLNQEATDAVSHTFAVIGLANATFANLVGCDLWESRMADAGGQIHRVTFEAKRLIGFLRETLYDAEQITAVRDLGQDDAELVASESQGLTFWACG